MKERERGPFFRLMRPPVSMLPRGTPPLNRHPFPPVLHGEEEGTVHRARPLIPGTWAENTEVFLRDSKEKLRGGNVREEEGEKETAERGTRETVARNSVVA